MDSMGMTSPRLSTPVTCRTRTADTSTTQSSAAWFKAGRPVASPWRCLLRPQPATSRSTNIGRALSRPRKHAVASSVSFRTPQFLTLLIDPLPGAEIVAWEGKSRDYPELSESRLAVAITSLW